MIIHVSFSHTYIYRYIFLPFIYRWMVFYISLSVTHPDHARKIQVAHCSRRAKRFQPSKYNNQETRLTPFYSMGWTVGKWKLGW